MSEQDYPIVRGNNRDFFIKERAIEILLRERVLFANSRHYLESGEIQPETIILFVSCNDLFVWASADAETITIDELPELWKMYQEDKTWGSDIWCCLKRKMRPQQPVIEAMKKDGVWSAELEALKD